MDYFNFYFIKKLLHNKKIKNYFVFIIISILFIFIKNYCFAVTPSAVFDIERELRDNQIVAQDTFAMHCVQPFIDKTEYWYTCLLPVFEDIDSKDRFFKIDTGVSSSTGHLRFTIRVFDINLSTTYTTNTVGMDGLTYSVLGRQWTNNVNIYVVDYDSNTNTGTMTVQYNQSFSVQDCVARTKSQFFLSFIKSIYEPDTTIILNDINDYLDNIDEVNTDILSVLQTMTSSLSSIQNNTSTNYSQQISQISSKIDDILTDNDTIINQNSSMIEQQEQINDNLEDIKDTLTDDTVESSASDLPSTNVQNPTENGIDNIFQSIYNAFCVGQAQDIIFPIPFTNKNITLSPYYVRDMLNNNNAGWIYTLIQAFWGYIIGRYIVSDISKKIDKIKSGNIENVENSNIKEEML